MAESFTPDGNGNVHARDAVLFNPNNFRNRVWHKALRDAGLERRKFHSLRSAFTVHSLSKGMPPHIVSKLLGHSDLTTTMNIYGKAIPLTDLVKETQKKAGVHHIDKPSEETILAGLDDFAADIAAESTAIISQAMYDASGNSMN